MLADVHKRVHDAVADLFLWQCKRRHGIQDREHGKHVLRQEKQLLLRFLPRDHGTAIALRSGGRQGEHGSQGQSAFHVGADRAENLPGVGTFEHGRGGNELGRVEDRTTPHGQDEPDLFAPHDFDRAQTGFILRIGFDSRKFDQAMIRQRLADLIVDAIAFDRSAAVCQQHWHALGNARRDLGNHALPEENFRGVLVGEIEHRGSPYFFVTRRS